MKGLNLTVKSSLVVFFIGGLTILHSCKKEEPLDPNPDMAKYQTEDYAGGTDFGGIGDTTGSGDGGNNGGNTNIDEHFTVEVDGVLMSFNNPEFQSIMGDQIINDPTSLDNQIQITSFSGFSIDTINYPTIAFFKDMSAYDSFDGRLIIDSLTTDFIKGTFYCNVASATGSDTISLTNGSFKVAK